MTEHETIYDSILMARPQTRNLVVYDQHYPKDAVFVFILFHPPIIPVR